MILDSLFRRTARVPAPSMTGTGFDLLEPVGSGVSVTNHNAMEIAAVYACVRLLSETLAQLPLVIRKRTESGSEPAYGHPLWTVLHDQPNPWMTSFTWRNTQMAHSAGWGNGYAYIVRDGRGQPRHLLPLRPDQTMPQVIDRRLSYLTTIGDMTVEAQPHEVLHIPALGFDGIAGQSPISLHREAIGLGKAAQTFGARLFSNGSILSGILKHPGRMKRKPDKPDDPTPVDRLRRQWKDLYSGSDNAFSVAVLEEGMEFQRIGIPPEDSQFLETRKFQVSEIARIFNVPSHMINDLERATFNNISELSIGFLRYTMTPWIVRWEQELNRKLFSGQDEYYVKFNVNGLLRGTQQDRADYYKMAIEYGWMSRNEVRELEDLNHVDGLDEYLQPLNMGSGQSSGETVAGQEGEEG